MTGRAYLSIGDVLSLLREEFPDVTISKIRFLESQGLVNPERSPSGYRKFYEHDVERLRWVLRQQREHFLPLKVIRDRLAVAGKEGVPAPEPASEQVPAATEPLIARAPALAQVSLSAGQAVHGEQIEIDRIAVGGMDFDPATELDPFEGIDEVNPNAVRPNEDSPNEVMAELRGEPRSPATPPPVASRDAPARPADGHSRPMPGTGAPSNIERLVREGSTELAPRVPPSRELSNPQPEPPIAGGAVLGAGRPGPTGSAPGAPPQRAPVRAVPPAVLSKHEVDPRSGRPTLPERAAAPANAEGGYGVRKEVRANAGSPSGIDASSFFQGPGPAGGSGASITFEELVAATGLSPDDVVALEGFGILEPMVVAGAVYYDEEALVAAHIVADFARYGIEPRHLRLYRNAVDREIGLIEQIVTPLLRQRNPEARQRAVDAATDIVRQGQALRSSLLRRELRRQLGR